MDIREAYDKIRKECLLPDFETFNREFFIDDLEHGFLPKKIAERIIDKTSHYRQILENFLHADGGNFAILIELKCMTEKDKEKMMELYRDLVIIERSFLLADLQNGDFHAFLKENFAQWTAMRKPLSEIVVKAKDSWNNFHQMEESLGYLG